MIFANFTNVIKTRDYKTFCDIMSIEHGVGTEKYRTPAESRIARQFVLTVNTGRSGVFINFNNSVAVIVDKRYGASITAAIARVNSRLVASSDRTRIAQS